ncbi:MAG: hypothetical protein ACOX9C_00235 [Kiritimatiellia bacterium]|jgi:4-amino-4-deoxy-L-arabinose transferase-like glycosyltransferase
MKCNPSHENRTPTMRGLAIAASVLVLGACLVMRVLGAKWYALHGNPDYAVVVLMVRHMLAGVDFPVFFYGQAYMGSLEPAFSALLGLFLGPTPFAVCLGTGLMAFAMALAVHRLAWRVGGPVAAVAASALCLVGPSGYFHYMASPRGGYALGLLLTVLLLHEAVFLGADDEGGEGAVPDASSRRFLLLGFLVGLGFWNFWLVMPAVAVVCVMLLWRFRLRLFRPSVLVCGLIGFFAGSAPWWIWNARNGWQSLESAGGSPGVRETVRSGVLLFTERLPALFAYAVPDGKPQLGLVVLLAFLVLALAAAALPVRVGGAPVRRLRRLICACFLFVGAFAAAYMLSSFGAIHSLRYLLPFVPVFAVLAGSGIGVLMQLAAAAPRKRAWRLRAVAGVGILFVAFDVGARLPDLKHHGNIKAGWHDTALALAAHPGLPKEFFADFILYGVNWATEEAVCAVSPKLYRYAPFFDRLENADHPGVLENFRGFDHFLSNTCGRATFVKIPGMRIHYDILPPSGTRTALPPETITAMTDGAGRDWRAELTDCNGETFAELRDLDGSRQCELHIAFAAPVKVCGLRAINRPRHAMEAWSVEGRDPASGEWHVLSGLFKETGHYWSGPRFHYLGSALRIEKTFPAAEVSELRVRMSIHSSCPSIFLETLHVMTPSSSSADLDMAAVARRIQVEEIDRVFADRWHAREIHRLTDGAVWTSREVADDVPVSHIGPADGVAVAVEDAEAGPTRAALRAAGVEAEAFSVGGMTVFKLAPPRPEGARSADLMFYGGMLHANRPPPMPDVIEGSGASFYDGGLVLRGVSGLQRLDASGTRFALEMVWDVKPDFAFPDNLGLSVKVLDASGRVVSRVDEPFCPDLNVHPGRLGTAFKTVLHFTAPEDAESAALRLAFGIPEYGLLPRRAKPTTSLDVVKRRMILPLRVSDATPVPKDSDGS